MVQWVGVPTGFPMIMGSNPVSVIFLRFRLFFYKFAFRRFWGSGGSGLNGFAFLGAFFAYFKNFSNYVARDSRARARSFASLQK